MAKMFYTTDEASQKLSVDNDQLKTLVSENKLREFRDGARVKNSLSSRLQSREQF